jgi:hypothetical protein
MKHYSQNKKNDEDYVYDIDFEKYVDKIVNSDDEINVIITEKEFYDKDHVYNSSLPNNNNTRVIYHKGSIYTHKNNLDRNYATRNYANRNNLNRNNNIDSILKKVSFSNEIKIIDDEINTFRENNNFNQCNDDVRNKKFNNFIPKGKYVFSHK